MANKFLSDIDLTARLRANGNEGDPGQVLSSTVSGVEWIDQASIEASSNLVYFDVKNETGSTISKGKGVMAVGTDGNSGHILIDEMVGDGTIESKYFLGVLEENIANGAFARVISFGEISQFNTNGQNGETWADGNILWCDPVNAGDFTITEPDGPNVKIAAAIILNSSTNGKIQVRVQANEGVHDLHDTKITSQVDGDVLVWNDTDGVWFNDSTLNVDYTAGNVGIGITDPSEKLEVDGNVQIGQTTDAKLYMVSTGGNGNNERFFIEGYADGGTYGGGFRLQTRNDSNIFNPAVSVNRYGNVGIGTTSPVNGGSLSKWLTLNGTSTSYSGGLVLAVNGTQKGYVYSQEGFLKIQGVAGEGVRLEPNGQPALTALSDGNVGIGITSPQANRKLDVNGHIQTRGNLYVGQVGSTATSHSVEVGAGRGNDGIAYLDLTGDTTYPDFGLRVIRDGTGANTTSRIIHRGTGNFFIETYEGADVVFNVGNVGIGTTSPTPGARLDVAGRVFATQLRVDSSLSQGGVILNASGDGSNIKFNNTSGSNAYIQTNGGNLGLGRVLGNSTGNLNINLANGYIGVKQKNPQAPLHVKKNGEAIRLESTGDNQCSIDFWQGSNKKGHIEFNNGNDTLEIKTQNPTGTRSQIKFKVASQTGGTAEEFMRIQGAAGEFDYKQVVIGGLEYTNSSKELFVNGGILATEKCVLEDDVSIGGRCDADSFKLKGLNDAPPTSTSIGTIGEIRYTTDYIYVCVQNSVWKRVALSSF
mgnify:CR=1 FL=1